MELSDLYSDIIKEHSASQHNKRHISNPEVTVPGINPSCGDEIELELRTEDGLIADGSFTGAGCAISQASVSIMLDLVRGKTRQEARELAELFLEMTRRRELSDEESERLEEAVALQGISNMPARVKCATMPWHTLLKAIDKLEKGGNEGV